MPNGCAKARNAAEQHMVSWEKFSATFKCENSSAYSSSILVFICTLQNEIFRNEWKKKQKKKSIVIYSTNGHVCVCVIVWKCMPILFLSLFECRFGPWSRISWCTIAIQPRVAHWDTRELRTRCMHKRAVHSSPLRTFVRVYIVKIKCTVADFLLKYTSVLYIRDRGHIYCIRKIEQHTLQAIKCKSRTTQIRPNTISI